MNGQLIIKTEPEFIIQDDENIAIVQYFSSDNNDDLVTEDDGDDGVDDEVRGGDQIINYVDAEGRFNKKNTNFLTQKQLNQSQQQQQQRNQSFSTNGHSHKIGITNEPISQTKIYVCNVCNEQFDRSYQLKRHHFVGEHVDSENVSKIKKKTTSPAIPVMLHRANGLSTSSSVNSKQLKRISNDVPAEERKQTSQFLYSKFGEKSQAKLTNSILSTNQNGNFNENTIKFEEQRQNLKTNLSPLSTLINFKSERLNQNHEHVNDHTSQDEHDDEDEIDQNDSYEYNNGSNVSNGSRVLMNVVTRTGNNQLAKKKQQFSHLTTDETEWSHIIICDIEGDNGESFEDIMFKCQLCNIYFSEIDLLDNHLQLHNPGISYAYQCELCDEIFSHVSILRNHVYRHVNWKNRYKCTKCEKSFETRLSLCEHTSLRMTSGCAPLQHKCIKCKKIFLTERLLIAHQFYHTGKKEYKCKYCPTVNLNNDSLPTISRNSINIKEFIHWSSLQMHLQSNEACKERREIPTNDFIQNSG